MKKCDEERFNRIIDLIVERSGFTMYDDKMKEIEKKIVKKIKETRKRAREIKNITDPIEFF